VLMWWVCFTMCGSVFILNTRLAKVCPYVCECLRMCVSVCALCECECVCVCLCGECALPCLGLCSSSTRDWQSRVHTCVFANHLCLCLCGIGCVKFVFFGEFAQVLMCRYLPCVVCYIIYWACDKTSYTYTHIIIFFAGGLKVTVLTHLHHILHTHSTTFFTLTYIIHTHSPAPHSSHSLNYILHSHLHSSHSLTYTHSPAPHSSFYLLAVNMRLCVCVRVCVPVCRHVCVPVCRHVCLDVHSLPLSLLAVNMCMRFCVCT